MIEDDLKLVQQAQSSHKVGLFGVTLRSKGGFTLIELIVTIAGFSLIAFGLIGLISNVFTENNKSGGALTDIDSARRVAAGFARITRTELVCKTITAKLKYKLLWAPYFYPKTVPST
jgi:type II secretory pathway component PulJ